MKKTINCRILKISMLLFSCFWWAGFGFDGEVLAAGKDNITVYSNIYNASQTINAKFTYEVVPNAANPVGAANEPTGFAIDFNNVVPAGNLTTLTYDLSFAGTTFANNGVYKYTVQEVTSSNPDYRVSSEKYEIYVTVTASGIDVSQAAKNLDTGTKGPMNFNHEPDYSFVRINLTVIGDAMDKQEYFKFKVFVDSKCMGCKYDILGQDEYVNFEGSTIKTADDYTVFAGAGGARAVYAVQNSASGGATRAMFGGSGATKGGATYVANGVNHIYAKDGQSVTIGLTAAGGWQIPVGTLVRVMNDQSLNLRKWTMYIDGVETREFEHIVGQNIDFNIVIKRNMLVPNTGIFAESWPYLLLTIIGLVGLGVFLRLKIKDAK